MHRSRRSQVRGGLPLLLAGTVMRALDTREVSRASEVMGARAAGGEVSAVARRKDEAGEEIGEGQPV
jgi:hypothetical protein